MELILFLLAGLLSLTESQSEWMWCKWYTHNLSRHLAAQYAYYDFVQSCLLVWLCSNLSPSLQPGPSPLWLSGGLCPGLQTVGSVHHRPRVWEALLCLVRHEQWRGMDCVSETTRRVRELLPRVDGVWKWVWKCERRALVGPEEDPLSDISNRKD